MEAPAKAMGVAEEARVSRLDHFLDSEKWLSRLMIGPAILFIIAVVGFPFFLALFYSVSDITVGSTSMGFVGLENFQRIIQDHTFQRALKNTFIFAIVSNVIVLVLAKVLALALLKDFRGKWAVRLLILLPWVAPISLGSIGWLWILDSIYSIINWTLRAVGIFGPHTWPIWLGQPDLAMASVITVHTWRLLPLATIILLAGLTSIPHDIHDSAAVDGAGFWRHLFEITIPLVMPIMLVAVLFGIVFTFTDMIVIYVLTRGGPYDTTQVLASLAFFTGIDGGDLAEGAAIALFLFPVLAASAILLLRVARRAEVS
jgi:multiple sugar transport system permease protein